MNFNYEELEKLQDDYNALFDKCNLAMGTISRELTRILNEVESDMKTYIGWEFGDHLKSIDDITITKNGIEYWNDELVLYLLSEEFEDGSFEFKIPKEWLEVDDDVMVVLIKKWIENEVNEFVKRKKIKIKNIKDESKNDLIKRINELDSEEVLEILKEIPSFKDSIK